MSARDFRGPADLRADVTPDVQLTKDAQDANDEFDAQDSESQSETESESESDSTIHECCSSLCSAGAHLSGNSRCIRIGVVAGLSSR